LDALAGCTQLAPNSTTWPAKTSSRTRPPIMDVACTGASGHADGDKQTAVGDKQKAVGDKQRALQLGTSKHHCSWGQANIIAVGDKQRALQLGTSKEHCSWGQANSIDAVTGDTSKTARSATPAAASAAAAEMPANGMSRCEGKVRVCRASAPAAPAPSTATCEWVTQPCGGCARAVCAVAAAEENSRSKAARGANCMASAGGSWYQRASCCRSDSQDSTKQAFHV